MTAAQRRRLPEGREGERGFALPLSAVLLVVMLLMSAFVVDIGRLSLERRRDQSAADVALISGAMNRSSDLAMATAIIDSLNTNLATTFTLADLHTCGADTLPSNWIPLTTANCIARDTSYTQLRLRIPTQTFQTSFAGLAGIQELPHTAIAAVSDLGKGNVLPFVISASAGGYECLKVGASNVPDPDCSDNASGNFGTVTFGLWGNSQTGTVTDCNGTSSQLVVNLAQGIDHDLSVYGGSPHGNVQVVDTASCGAIPAPNAMTTTTGNTPNLLYAGILGSDTFPDGGPSRFRRVNGMSWFGTANVAGATVDDTPLWEFIDTGLSSTDSVPRSCYKDQFIGDGGGLNPDNDQLMTNLPYPVAQHLLLIPKADRMIKLVERCFDHYEGNSWDDGGAFQPADPPVGCGGIGVRCLDSVFNRDSDREQQDIVDIQASARFGYVPEMPANTNLNGNTTILISGFRAVFLQRTYAGNCNNSGCPITFDPGLGYTSNQTTNKASALTAFVFPPGILPNGLADDDAINDYGTNRFIELTR